MLQKQIRVRTPSRVCPSGRTPSRVCPSGRGMSPMATSRELSWGSQSQRRVGVEDPRACLPQVGSWAGPCQETLWGRQGRPVSPPSPPRRPSVCAPGGVLSYSRSHGDASSLQQFAIVNKRSLIQGQLNLLEPGVCCPESCHSFIQIAVHSTARPSPCPNDTDCKSHISPVKGQLGPINKGSSAFHAIK